MQPVKNKCTSESGEMPSQPPPPQSSESIAIVTKARQNPNETPIPPPPPPPPPPVITGMYDMISRNLYREPGESPQKTFEPNQIPPTAPPLTLPRQKKDSCCLLPPIENRGQIAQWPEFTSLESQYPKPLPPPRPCTCCGFGGLCPGCTERAKLAPKPVHASAPLPEK